MPQTRSPISLPKSLAIEVDQRATEDELPRSAVLVNALAKYLDHMRASELTAQLKDAYGDETDAERARWSAWTNAGRRTVATRLANDEW